MSVIVKDMEMPECCGQCFLRVGNCKQRIYMEQRPKNCPLIELPPHGRLADLDKMIDDFWDGNHMTIYGTDLRQISTVIEAEE